MSEVLLGLKEGRYKIDLCDDCLTGIQNDVNEFESLGSQSIYLR